MERPFPGDENRLAVQISEGSAEAFRELYDRYFDRVTAFCFSLCKSPSATEEVVQECFIKLWSSRTNLAEVRHMESYLFTIAKNSVIDYLRKLHRQTRFISMLHESASMEGKPNQHRLYEKDLQRLIETALKDLGTQKQNIFFMSKVEGMSHEEIAEALQLSRSTVRNHLSETLRHIRRYIGDRPESGLLVMLASSLCHLD